MTKPNDWAAEQARRIGDTVFKLRGSRSGLWLSNETAKAGHRISRTSISELESGKRKSVSTAELIILAVALRVPPIRLLYPDLPDGVVEFVPGRELPSFEAVQKFSGEQPYARRAGELSIEEAREEAREVLQGMRVLELARQQAMLEGQLMLGSYMAEEAEESKNELMMRTAHQHVALTLKELESVQHDLRDTDGAVVRDGR